MITTLSRLRFHSLKGADVVLTHDNIRAERIPREHPYDTVFGFGGPYLAGSAVVFSHRPIEVDEMICLRVQLPHYTTQTRLGAGVTSINPNTLTKAPCNKDLISLAGFSIQNTDSDGFLKFYVDSLSNLHYRGHSNCTLFLGEVTSCLWVVAVVPLPLNIMEFHHQATTLSSPTPKISGLDGNLTELPGSVDCVAEPVQTRMPRNQSTQVQPTTTSDIQSSAKAECIICCDGPVDSALSPCGHMFTCHRCALDVWRGSGRARCPTCRQLVTSVLRIYTD